MIRLHDRRSTVRALVAAVALAVVLVGSLAHHHVGPSGEPDSCIACALHVAGQADPAPAPAMRPPDPPRPVEQPTFAALAPRPVLPLHFAPKTSPPA